MTCNYCGYPDVNVRDKKCPMCGRLINQKEEKDVG